MPGAETSLGHANSQVRFFDLNVPSQDRIVTSKPALRPMNPLPVSQQRFYALLIDVARHADQLEPSSIWRLAM